MTFRELCAVSARADREANVAMGNRQPASWAGMLLEAMSLYSALTLARAIVRTLEAIEVEESEAARGRTGT